jgi:hypothetical protein
MNSVLDLPIVVDTEVRQAHFACDLGACGGACCTMEGGRGAPVTAEELANIRGSLDAIVPFLGGRSREEIAKHGLAEGAAADLALRCIDDRDCIFVLRENGIARCAVERAFHNGATAFRKPVSCHLFPIRVSRGPIRRLHLERIEECGPGYERGEKERIRLVDFAGAALERAFGDEVADRLRGSQLR